MDVPFPSQHRVTPRVLALLAAAAIGAGATAGAYQAFAASPSAGPGERIAPATFEPTSVAGSTPATLAQTAIGDDGCVMVLRPHPC